MMKKKNASDIIAPPPSQPPSVVLNHLDVFCQSDSLSEDGLRAIIEQHGWASNHPTIPYDFFLSACRNERVTEGILRYLLRIFPSAGTFINRSRNTPMHIICHNKNVTPGMVQLLIDAAPDSLDNEDSHGGLPLHCLCVHKNLDDEVASNILKLLLEKCPESARHDIPGSNTLPIHLAAMNHSPEFCRLLIEAYPESERISNSAGMIPFLAACNYGTVATAEFLYELYPESINVAEVRGAYPIHLAILSVKLRANPATAIDVVQFLLDCDPNVVLQKFDDILPLYWACDEATNENTTTMLKILQILYDAHPEAIESDAYAFGLVPDIPEEVQTFISTHLTHARQARDLRQMNTTDENGQLPLHRALRDNVRLGSIKLLVKGNPSATRNRDNNSTLPLHIACQNHDSADVVQYMIDRDSSALEAVDRQGNTVLHYACRGAKHGTITLLLEKYGAASVSKFNAHNQLPIDLLFESEAVIDRGGTEYTESIYRLIRAHPETVMFSSNATN
jgi:ankyrin repeat protein